MKYQKKAEKPNIKIRVFTLFVFLYYERMSKADTVCACGRLNEKRHKRYIYPYYFRRVQFNMNKGQCQNLSLQAFSIETGGGMNGGRNILCVRSDVNQNIVTVYKAVNSMWYLKPQAELYVADSSLINRIQQIIIEEKLYHAPKLPISKIQVFDAPSTSYHASFSDGAYFTYSSNQKLSSKICNANNKIKAVIREYCSTATACPTIYAEADGEYTAWKKRGGITIDCSNKSAFSMNLNIYNAKGDKAELKGNVSLSKMEGDRAVCTEILAENYKVDVYAESEESVTVELPFARYPEEGTYKIEYAGCETIFEMKIYKIE